MKKDKIIYWATTGIIAAIMLWSAYSFSFNEEMKGGFGHLGLPGWFRIELSVAKATGVLALVIPMVPNRIKEFAYFGFALTTSSACIAHLSSGDGFLRSLEPLVFLGILIVSYLYHQKQKKLTRGFPRFVQDPVTSEVKHMSREIEVSDQQIEFENAGGT
jgi:hypothetical protein